MNLEAPETGHTLWASFSTVGRENLYPLQDVVRTSTPLSCLTLASCRFLSFCSPQPKVQPAMYGRMRCKEGATAA